MHIDDEDRFEMTLDPPGKIVVVGAGALGLEAALYGRFLGYEVEVFEKNSIGDVLRASSDNHLPMLPDRCLSPLAVSALKAQDGGLVRPGDLSFPQTVEQWIENGMKRIAATDLLSERIHQSCVVVSLGQADDFESLDDQDSTEDEDTYIDGEVPPDFRLSVHDANSNELRLIEAEAVIIAIGAADRSSIVGLESLVDAPYLFEIGRHGKVEEDDEARLHRGWREIVMVFAGLGGRRSLDLYRPLRS